MMFENLLIWFGIKVAEKVSIEVIKQGAEALWDEHSDEFLEWLKKKGMDIAKDKGEKILKEQWENFNFSQAQEKYKNKLAKNNEFTRIFGNPEPTPLEGIFTDVYILDKPLASRRYDLKNLQVSDEMIHGREGDRHNGIELIKEPSSHRRFILGKPGAGKTTFLKYITLQAAKGTFHKTPIFVGLNEWSNATKDGSDTHLTLMEFITQRFDNCNFPDAKKFIEFLLTKKEVILLFDGLDEVDIKNNHRVVSEISSFCEKYDKAQCLITCRVAAVDYNLRAFDGFSYAEMADFSDAQVAAFVERWFASEPEKAKKFLADLKEETHKKLKELTSNPLLLGMLCLSFKDLGKFGQTRIKIYDNAINALLEELDESKRIKRDSVSISLNSEDKKALFSEVAYEFFQNDKLIFSGNELVKSMNTNLTKIGFIDSGINKLDTRNLLKDVEVHHGILVERAQEVYSFAHLTFQEYFTACAISKNEKYQQMLMQSMDDKRYREVFLLTASSLDDADNFFKIFKQAIDNLIIKDEKILALLEWAKNKADTIESPYPKRDVYLFYVFLEIASARARDRDLARLARDHLHLALARLARDHLHLALDHLARTLDLARDLDRALDRALDLDLDRALDLDLDLDLNSEKMKFDYIFYFVKIIYNYKEKIVERESMYRIVLDFMKKASLSELAESFENKEWGDFESKLAILTQNQNIALDWNLSSKQVELFISYIEANKFCRECLNLATELATVSNRQALEDNLFFTAKPENKT